MVACPTCFRPFVGRIIRNICRECRCAIHIFFVLMKKIFAAIQKIGKTISRTIITIALTIVYVIFFPLYAMFIRFNRKIISGHRTVKREDIEKMF